jgi:acyl-CoA thioester hydrolase
MKPPPFVPEPVDGDGIFVKNKTDNSIWHRCQTRTLYADTDRSQVVYHSNYLRYFELGRATLMRDVGYPYREIEESGYIYPIIEIGVNYYAPLFYDDAFWVFTRPAELERTKLKFDYAITKSDTGVLICKGFTRHCAANKAGRPVGVDERTQDLWKNYPPIRLSL